MSSKQTVMCFGCALMLAISSACGDDSSAPGGGGATGEGGSNGDGGSDTGDAQTPPQGQQAVDAWLAKGDYKSWACEPAVHEARSPSPHGFNRICSNDLLSSNATGTNDWPKGSASVKELYDSADASEPIGYAVYLKLQDDSAGGANWYWYEDTGSAIAADGLGDSGGAKTICVGCHIGAGSDAAHTPSPGARDLVYTPVE